MSEPRLLNVILFKVTGMLSMLATSYMMYEILTDKKKRRRTYHRLMFGLSFIEFCDGLAFFLGPWASPGGVWGVGNNASCQFQGFLLQASIGSTLYNAFLALYYLLMIRYNWSERRIAQKVEPWMHGIALSIAYGTAIACIPLGLYMSLDTVCYISKQPRGCQESYQFGDDATCTQGDNATLYTIFFFTIWQWTCIVFTAVTMTMVWCGVRAQENKMAKYSFGDKNREPVRKNSRKFMIQGLLYVFVFYFSHFFATVNLQMIQAGNFNGRHALSLSVGLTYPLEGFLNFLVYMRPRMVKYLKKRRERLKVASKESHNATTNTTTSTTARSKSRVNVETAITKSCINVEGEEQTGDANQDLPKSISKKEICLDGEEQNDLDEC